MRVLVTGSDGYIGAVLAPYLADAGHDVVHPGCSRRSRGTGHAWPVPRNATAYGVSPRLRGDVVVNLVGSPSPPAPCICHAFNVGRTEAKYRIREVAEMVREVVPGSEVTFAEDAGPDLRCYRVDCAKLARLPGGRPALNSSPGGGAALPGVQGARPGRRRPPPAGGSSGPPGSGRCWRPAALRPDLRWRTP